MSTSTSPAGSPDRHPDRRPGRPRRTAPTPVTATEVGDVEGRTFRSSGQTVVCTAMAVLWPLVLCSLAVSARDDPGLAASLAAGGILGCWLYARAAVMRLDVDAEGLTVVGFTRRRFVAWPEVVGVLAGYEGLRIVTAEGRGPVLHSISRSRRSVTTGIPGFADALAERLTDEARGRQER